MALPDPATLDWGNPEAPVSKHFTVREALWLPKWGRLASEGDGLDLSVRRALTEFLQGVMDPLREYLDAALRVHCCYRPKQYNLEVGGAPESGHLGIHGFAAIDFDIVGENCDMTRKRLMSSLETRRIRMEDLPGAAWVHLDNKPASSPLSRFFKP